MHDGSKQNATKKITTTVTSATSNQQRKMECVKMMWKQRQTTTSTRQTKYRNRSGCNNKCRAIFRLQKTKNEEYNTLGKKEHMKRAKLRQYLTKARFIYALSLALCVCTAMCVSCVFTHTLQLPTFLGPFLHAHGCRAQAQMPWTLLSHSTNHMAVEVWPYATPVSLSLRVLQKSRINTTKHTIHTYTHTHIISSILFFLSVSPLYTKLVSTFLWISPFFPYSACPLHRHSSASL